MLLRPSQEGRAIATTTRQLAVTVAKACDAFKASGIVILDVRKLTSISDYFIVCSVGNERQARAISDDLRVSMKELGERELGVEGIHDGKWILQDFGAVVVHVFHESQREFYDIEGLWADAPQVKWKAASKKK
ncbi:MAG TPA: ribosome silencing factor [Planctomycetota bacterium]